MYCRKCGDTTCSDCRNTDMNVNCGCHNSHICQMDGENRPICLRAEQEEALQASPMLNKRSMQKPQRSGDNGQETK